MTDLLVLTNPTLDDARIVVHVDAAPEHIARGWVQVGPCSNRFRDPLLSDDEQATVDEAALTDAGTPESVDVPASKPRAKPRPRPKPAPAPTAATPDKAATPADDTQEK